MQLSSFRWSLQARLGRRKSDSTHNLNSILSNDGATAGAEAIDDRQQVDLFRRTRQLAKDQHTGVELVRGGVACEEGRALGSFEMDRATD